jgi:hypothetical protein
MSNFILNLVRRGAGLAPVVALQPPFAPGLAPELGAAHTTGPEMAPADGATPEIPVQSATEPTLAPPAASTPMAPMLTSAPPATPPAETPRRRAQAPATPSPPQPPTGTVAVQVQIPRPGEPTTPQPPPAEPLPGGALTGVMPQIPEMSEPEAVAKVQPAVQAPGDVPEPGHLSGSPTLSPAQPPPAEPLPGGAPTSGLALGPGTKGSDAGLVGAPETRRPQLAQAEAEPATALIPTGVMPQIPEMSEPEAVAKVQPAVQAPGDVPEPGHLSGSPTLSPAQPPPAEPLPRPQTSRDTFARSETCRVAAIHPAPIPWTREASEPEAVAKVQPATPPVTDMSPPLIRPAPTQPPTFPTPVEPAITQSEPRSIHVHIGTIEVRATTPPPPAPPPAPAPQGFDDYVLVRNYLNWEQY